MGHYCKICGTLQPNEAFSGRGWRNHICKRCAALPQATRDAIQQEEEIFGFLFSQSHISKKNRSRPAVLANSANPRIAELAAVVEEVAKATPYKRRRLKILKQKRPDLLDKLRETGLLGTGLIDVDLTDTDLIDTDFTDADDWDLLENATRVEVPPFEPVEWDLIAQWAEMDLSESDEAAQRFGESIECYIQEAIAEYLYDMENLAIIEQRMQYLNPEDAISHETMMHK